MAAAAFPRSDGDDSSKVEIALSQPVRGKIGSEEPAGRLGREREELPAAETERRRS